MQTTHLGRDPVKFQKLLVASRKNYALVYKRKNIKQKKIVIDKESKTEDETIVEQGNKTSESGRSDALPVSKNYKVKLGVRKPPKKGKI
jgi:hypothetical protein